MKNPELLGCPKKAARNAKRRERYRADKGLRLRQSAYAKAYYLKNKTRLLGRTRAAIAKNTELIIAAKRRQCMDCGFVYPHYVMDFDHRPGTVKKGNVSQMLSATRRRLLAEIAKCDVVCANCHRERTHGVRR